MTGNIIVVDDDSTSLKLLNNILNSENYSVRLFISGDLALRSMNAEKPDLILLDIRMPNMDGFEVCSKLKMNEKLKDIPVIFLSAATDIEDKIKAFQAGGVDYITKPFQTEEILARVATHLKLHAALKELQAISTELRNSVSRYRSVVEDQTEVIARFLPDGTFLFVNDVYCRVFGKTSEELIGQRWHPAAHPDDLTMIETRLHEMSPDHPVVTIENRVFVGGGELRWMQFVNRGFYAVDGTLMEIQSVGRDITAKREALANLQASEERYRTLVETTSVVTWFCPSTGLNVAPQPVWMAFTGQTAEEMLGTGWTKAVHPDDVAAAAERWQSAVERGEAFSNLHRIRRHDGAWRWMNVRAVPVHDRQGRIIEWMGMGQDVTVQKQAEMALAESGERLELALAGSGLVLWDWNISERKVTAGNRWFELLGYMKDELGGNEDDWIDLINPKDLERFKQKLSSHLQGETASFESEHRLRHKDGHWVSVEARGKVTLRDKDNAPLRMVGTILDVTQRKRLNEEGMDLLKRVESLIRESSSPSPVKAEDGKAAESLTKRQRQILGMIAAGMTSAEIGKRLYLSTPTVISHRRNLMAKLNLHSTADVTRFAIDHDLLATK